jgi:glutathione S-transferase
LFQFVFVDDRRLFAGFSSGTTAWNFNGMRTLRSDAQLAIRAFVCGNPFTTADFTLAAPLIFAERAQISAPALVVAWFQRVAAIDAYKRTVPQLP